MSESPVAKRLKRSSGAQLVFTDKTVVKYQSAEKMRLEIIKSKRAAAIGTDTGLFSVPRIISHDRDKGSITFERVHGLRNTREVLSEFPSSGELLVRLGKILATIHNQLNLPADIATVLPDMGLKLNTQPVFIHGDFSIVNIFYSIDRDELVIIDWSTSHWLGNGGTVGPCYIDLGIFIQSLFTRHLFIQPVIKNLEELGILFLKSYSLETKSGFCLEEFKCYFRAILGKYLRARIPKMPKWRLLLQAPSYWQVHSFMKKVSY